MNYSFSFLALVFLLMAFSAVPAMASNPHSTPGLDPSALTGLAAAGYMSYKALRAR